MGSQCLGLLVLCLVCGQSQCTSDPEDREKIVQKLIKSSYDLSHNSAYRTFAEATAHQNKAEIVGFVGNKLDERSKGRQREERPEPEGRRVLAERLAKIENAQVVEGSEGPEGGRGNAWDETRAGQVKAERAKQFEENIKRNRIRSWKRPAKMKLPEKERDAIDSELAEKLKQQRRALGEHADVD